MKISKIFVNRYALDFSIVLVQRSRGNHLFPRQMLSRHAEAVLTQYRTIRQNQQITIRASQRGAS
jgi:hypothetical protein